MLPSLTSQLNDNIRSLPRIYLLEVRDKHKPDGDPVRWILVERTEERSEGDDGKLITARIFMTFQPLQVDGAPHVEDGGVFAGSYSPGKNCRGPQLAITAADIYNGRVMIREDALRGNRIGTHLMNEIVEWAKQWPDASVMPITLSSADAEEDNRERRNLFYGNFGIIFPPCVGPLIEGRSLPMLAAQLTPHRTWEKNIIVKEIPSFIDKLRIQMATLSRENSNSAVVIEHLESTIEKASKRPVSWAFRQLATRAAGLFPLLIGLCTVVFLIWRIATDTLAFVF